MRIYVSSSFRNIHAVHYLRAILEADGHEVLDWTKLAPPIPKGTPAAARRAILDSDEHGQAFDFCAASCASADALIYQGPSGQDSGIELGIAFAAGVYILGLLGPFEEPGTMLNGVVHEWASDAGDLLRILKSTAKTPDGVKSYD